MFLLHNCGQWGAMIMRLLFLDHENEMARLEKALASLEGTFCCLY
jgi:hypothetical protein